MNTPQRERRAFTVTDLAVVVVLLVFVVLLAGSALSTTRARSRKVTCLDNLGQIGAAMLAYAAEDSREQIIPIHMNMVRSAPYWDWRLINSFVWGGQNATILFRYGDGGAGKYWLSEAPPPPEGGLWRPECGASRRPLNAYIPGEPGTYDIFRCPQDTGYPDSVYIDDSPPAQADVPCWDGLGNSYRANLLSYTFAGTPTSQGHFSFGPWGHGLSTLLDAGRLVLVADPLFYAQTRAYTTPDGNPPDEIAWGWHGRWMTENVLYCDGTARATSVADRVYGMSALLRPPSSLAGPHLEYPDIRPLDLLESLIRGRMWHTDCYPTPGAVIWGDWSIQLSVYEDCWPWMDAYSPWEP